MNNGQKLSYTRIAWKKTGLRKYKNFVTDKGVKQIIIDYFSNTLLKLRIKLIGK